MTIVPRSLKIAMTGSLIALLVSACEAPSPKPGEPTIKNPVEAQQNAEQLVITGLNSLEPIRSQSLLKAAAIFKATNNWQRLSELISQIDASQLTEAEQLQFGALYSESMLQQQQVDQALIWLETNQTLVNNNPALLTLQAQGYGDNNQPIAQVKTLLTLLSLSDDEEQQLQINDQVWQSLITTPSSRLQDALDKETEQSELAGWLSLATIAKDATGDISQTKQKLSFWQSAWSNHSANQMPPSSLITLNSLETPKNIAVLIPLSGRLKSAGNSIRDGIIAAHLNNNPSAELSLSFYDTNKQKDIAALYQQVVFDGADAVIGPLTRDNVTTLEQQGSLPVQTLALNFSEENANNSNLSKLGISADDDAQFASMQANYNNLNRALIIRSNKSWSQRAANAFSQNWQQQGGEIIATATFDGGETMSDAIKTALNLNYSEERKRYLQDVLGKLVESDPYRRKDIDMVFMATNSQEARSLKPILAFHYAGDLPVYATNQVNNGANNRSKDIDLSGIQFGEIPWAIERTELPLYNNITSHIRKGSSFSKNLYALGIDAYFLSQRLPLLDSVNNFNLQSHTGALMRETNGNINRIPQWAEFNRGYVVAKTPLYNKPRKEATDEMETTEPSTP